LLTYLGAAVIVTVDQLTKAWVVANLGDGQPPIVIVPNVLELIFRLNTGMAFSLLLDFPGLLTIIAAIASVTLIVIIWRLQRPWWALNLALALLLGGAVGNLIDRLTIGAVVDFVYLRLINFPAFNVADSALTCGVILAAWAMMQTGPPAGPDDRQPEERALTRADPPPPRTMEEERWPFHDRSAPRNLRQSVAGSRPCREPVRAGCQKIWPCSWRMSMPRPPSCSASVTARPRWAMRSTS
jgi:signal peptidase II